MKKGDFKPLNKTLFKKYVNKFRKEELEEMNKIISLKLKTFNN